MSTQFNKEFQNFLVILALRCTSWPHSHFRTLSQCGMRQAFRMTIEYGIKLNHQDVLELVLGPNNDKRDVLRKEIREFVTLVFCEVRAATFGYPLAERGIRHWHWIRSTGCKWRILSPTKVLALLCGRRRMTHDPYASSDNGTLDWALKQLGRWISLANIML